MWFGCLWCFGPKGGIPIESEASGTLESRIIRILREKHQLQVKPSILDSFVTGICRTKFPLFVEVSIEKKTAKRFKFCEKFAIFAIFANRIFCPPPSKPFGITIIIYLHFAPPINS